MLLYHAGVPGIAGGFVGVDVFFVISGFLITGLLLRELRSSGSVSLPRFYARRARRLLPAAMVALTVTMIVSAVVLPPLTVPAVAGDVAASALYVGNIHFALQATDYLQSDVAPSPVLHFWSLGVEEQFYLFWPALLLLVARATRATRSLERGVGMAVLAILAASVALSFWLTDVNQPWAFFSLPTRAWELALGAMIAVGATRLAVIPPRIATIAVSAGVGLIALAAIGLDTTTPFPGTAALLPVVGASLVVAGGLGPAETLPGRLLATRPMRWLGRISYSLYLWHWPVIVLPLAAIDADVPLAARIGLALLAVPLAAASQRWIEEPIRHGRAARLPSRSTLAAAGALSLAVALGALGLGATAGLPISDVVARDDKPVAVPDDRLDASPTPPRSAATPDITAPSSAPPSSVPPTQPVVDPIGGPLPADLDPPLSEARNDMPVIYTDGCHLAAVDVTSARCAYGEAGSTTEVVLFGDSHAAQWFPALEAIASQRGWRLTNLTKSACPSVDVTVWNGTLRREYRECDTWRESVLERIAASRPALVVLSNSRVATLIVDGKRVAASEAASVWQAGLDRTIGRLRAAAGVVVVIGDTPRASVDPPVCLSRDPADTLECSTPRVIAIDAAWLTGESATATRGGATFIDPSDMLCTADTCPAVVGSFLVQRDEHHLTTPFAVSLSPSLDAALPTIP